MTPANLVNFWLTIKRFEVIAILINFSWRPSLILQNFIFEPRIMSGVLRRRSLYNLLTIDVCFPSYKSLYENPRWRLGGHLVFKISGFEHRVLYQLRHWSYIPNLVKIGLAVNTFLAFLFPIEMHEKGAFWPFWVDFFFSKIVNPLKSTSLAKTGSFDVLHVKIGSALLSSCVTPQRTHDGLTCANTSFCFIQQMKAWFWPIVLGTIAHFVGFSSLMTAPVRFAITLE